MAGKELKSFLKKFVYLFILFFIWIFEYLVVSVIIKVKNLNNIEGWTLVISREQNILEIVCNHLEHLSNCTVML